MALAIKILIIVLLIMILFSLGRAMFYFMRQEPDSNKTLSSLKWRVGLSVSLFVVLIVAFLTGVIQPHSGPLTQNQTQQQAQ